MTKKDTSLMKAGRREFCKIILGGVSLLLIPGTAGHAKGKGDYKAWYGKKYNPKDHRYGMGINVERCIGCGRCVEVCPADINIISVIESIRGERDVKSSNSSASA